MHICAFLLAFLLGTSSALVAAPLTMKDAMQTALEKHPAIKEAAYVRDASTAAVSVSLTAYYPQLFLEEDFSAGNEPDMVFMRRLNQGRLTTNDMAVSRLNSPSASTNFRTAVTLEQSIFNPATAPLLAMARLREQAASERLAARREEVALQVVTAWARLRQARASEYAAADAVRDAREHLRIAQVRGKNGVGLKADELRAQAFLAEMEERLTEAKTAVAVGNMRLALAMGETPDTPVTVAEELPVIPEFSTDALMARAFERRPELRAAGKTVEQAKEGERLARRTWLPSANLMAQYRLDDRDVPFGRDNDAWTVGVGLRWEAFDGLRRSRETDRARAERSAMEQTYELLRREVRFQVLERGLVKKGAAEQVEAARAARESAEEGLRLMEKRYENSLSALIDVLDAQTALNRARAAETDAEANLLLAAAGELYAAGILTEEVGK